MMKTKVKELKQKNDAITEKQVTKAGSEPGKEDVIQKEKTFIEKITEKQKALEKIRVEKMNADIEARREAAKKYDNDRIKQAKKEWQERSEKINSPIPVAENENFVPIQIGESNTQRINKAFFAYTHVLQIAEKLWNQVSECLKLKEKLPVDKFFEFLKSDPEKWIYQEHIQKNDIKYPGLDTDRIIELRLLTIEGIEIPVETHAQLITGLQKIKESGFVFPLRKLYDLEKKEFTLTDVFFEESEMKFSRHTQSKEQNVILSKFQRICDALNELSELGVLRPQHGPNELALLNDCFEISNESKISPFVISDVLFWKNHRLKRYRPKRSTMKKGNSFNDFFQ
jgi:hypothetical protein